MHINCTQTWHHLSACCFHTKLNKESPVLMGIGKYTKHLIREELIHQQPRTMPEVWLFCQNSISYNRLTVHLFVTHHLRYNLYRQQTDTKTWSSVRTTVACAQTVPSQIRMLPHIVFLEIINHSIFCWKLFV
jgi:hypothetical protein